MPCLLRLRFVACCEWSNLKRKRACAFVANEQANISGDRKEGISVAEVDTFEKEAKRRLRKQGWCFKGPVLCPEHNTPGNRKKRKVPEPQKGSLASSMREMRLGE